MHAARKPRDEGPRGSCARLRHKRDVHELRGFGLRVLEPPVIWRGGDRRGMAGERLNYREVRPGFESRRNEAPVEVMGGNG